jgi:hypothetical protein
MCGAQVQAQEMPFNNGEVLNFTVNYKYGLVNVKGGSAVYRSNSANYKGKPAMKTELTFKTTPFVDNVVMKNMRDTLLSYTSLPDLTPIYHQRRIHEGKSNYVEDMYIQKHGVSYTETLVKRDKGEDVVEETLTKANNAGYDFLNLFILIRTSALSIKEGEVKSISALMGKKVIAMTIHNTGNAVVNKNNAIHFTVDIIDSKTFTTANKAMEVWISDDDNHVILKLKAKLKIGAAEATLTSYKNLKDGSKSYK